MNPHFFGDSNHPLFGVHHPARSRGGQRPAVLLCPPIGHEYVRTHWAMRMLASKLARQGHHVLRFDYRGIGDSWGSPSEVAHLVDWVDNVAIAARDLMDESGSSAVSIVGLRFGAALASLAIAEGLHVANAIFWEPVWSGEEYLADLRAMHATMLDLWVCPMSTVNDGYTEEILGTAYARSLLCEVQQFDFVATLESLDFVPTIVRGAAPLRTVADAKVVHHDEPTDWNDLAMIETAWLPSAAPPLVLEALRRNPGTVANSPAAAALWPTPTIQEGASSAGATS